MKKIDLDNDLEETTVGSLPVSLKTQSIFQSYNKISGCVERTRECTRLGLEVRKYDEYDHISLSIPFVSCFDFVIVIISHPIQSNNRLET